jgi:hypothetical protein
LRKPPILKRGILEAETPSLELTRRKIATLSGKAWTDLGLVGGTFESTLTKWHSRLAIIPLAFHRKDRSESWQLNVFSGINDLEGRFRVKLR